jgi:hypothetical protein
MGDGSHPGEHIMAINDWLAFIKEVARDNEFEVHESAFEFEIATELWHSVQFRVRQNPYSGYLEVSQYEQGHEYGRAVCSLRLATDVAHFCSILAASSLIRAKRAE